MIEPVAEAIADTFSRDHAPVLACNPGDSLTVRTFNSAGHPSRMTKPGVQPQVALPARRGHCLVGPIAVRGARPGRMLSIHVRSLRPDDWGFTVAGGRDSAVNQRLGITDEDPAWLLWTITGDTATSQHGVSVRTGPFFGVMGVAPEAAGEHSTIPPRAACGGNIDCKELGPGSTLFLPVAVDDALLYLGDGHAAQGDGEVGGTAIECGMTSDVVLDLIDDRPISTVHATTPTHDVTFGFHADLNEAMGDALEAMLRWMQASGGLDRRTALAYASSTVDLRVTQVANQTWGVHAIRARST